MDNEELEDLDGIQEGVEEHRLAMTHRWEDSELAASAYSTGKMDPQASRCKKKYVSNASIDELFSHFVQISET